MATIEEMLVRIEAESTLFRAELQKATTAVDRFQRSVDQRLGAVDRRFEKLGASIRRFIPALSLGLLGRLGVQALEAAGGIGEMAEQVGVSARALQVLQYAAGQSGVELGELEAGLSFFSKTVGEAAEGTKTAVEAFDRLGVKILDANGVLRPTEDILVDVSNGLAKVSDDATRAAAAKDLLGRGGQKLLPILSGGAERLSEFAAAAERLGLVLSDRVIAQADKASDNLRALREVANKSFQVGLVEGMADGLDDLSAASEAASDVMHALGEAVGAAFRRLAEFVQFIEDNKTLISTLATGLTGFAVAGPVGGVAGAAGGFLLGEFAFKDEIDNAREVIAALEDQLEAAQISEKLGLPGATEQVRTFAAQLVEAESKLATLEATAAAANEATGGALGGETKGDRNPTKKGGSGDNEAKERERALEALNKLVEGYRTEAAAAGEVGIAKEKLVAAIKVEELARKAGVKNVDDYVQAINEEIEAAELAEEILDGQAQSLEAINELEEEGKQLKEDLRTAQEIYNDELEHYSELLRSNAIDYQTYARAVARSQQDLDEANEKSKESTKENLRAVGDFADAIGTAFEDAVLEGAKFRDAMEALAKDVVRILQRILITKPLESSLENILTGGKSGSATGNGIFDFLVSGFNWLSGFGGGSAGLTLGAGNTTGAGGAGFSYLQFGGPRAGGGPVSAFTPYMVGEQGPEMFVPNVSGSIVPNNRLAAGGGHTVVVNVNAPGGTGSSQARATGAQIGRAALAALASGRRIS